VRVAERLEKRESSWRELDLLVARLAGARWRRPSARDVLRLGELYRATCTDLMLAEDHDLPRETVANLHALVRRAHNVVYRASGFDFRDFGRALFQTAPRRLRGDAALRVAALVFWGTFAFTTLLAAGRTDFARLVLGPAFLEQFDHMYSQRVDPASPDGAGARRSDTMMAGFYIQHNASIGLRCFAWGILFGLGSLYQLFYNAMIFGTLCGYMTTRPQAANFFSFVTAHSAFELTAIIVSAAAGLRLGWGLIDTKGQSRVSSLAREAAAALPAIGAAVVLFVLAACVEGFVSASSLPYGAKAAVAIASAGIIVAYLTLGGLAPLAREELALAATTDEPDLPRKL
jgi:uncharacterized membrane protein SpoIIM required for sporulation